MRNNPIPLTGQAQLEAILHHPLPAEPPTPPRPRREPRPPVQPRLSVVPRPAPLQVHEEQQ